MANFIIFPAERTWTGRSSIIVLRCLLSPRLNLLDISRNEAISTYLRHLGLAEPQQFLQAASTCNIYHITLPSLTVLLRLPYTPTCSTINAFAASFPGRTSSVKLVFFSSNFYFFFGQATLWQLMMDVSHFGRPSSGIIILNSMRMNATYTLPQPLPQSVAPNRLDFVCLTVCES